MNAEDKQEETPTQVVCIARMLVVAYWLGSKSASSSDIPKTISAMMSKGHDGLNWQAFVPLATDVFKTIAPKKEAEQ